MHYHKSARFYDALYSVLGKDYAREVEQVHTFIQHYQPNAATLLDIGCGTGKHLATLQHLYRVAGLDLDEHMLAIAHQHLPTIPFYHADMVDFSLGQQFDVLTCLFSSIGYVQTVPRLQQAIGTMQRHIAAGGLLLLEPWFSPTSWNVGQPHALFVDQPDLKIARMSVSAQDGTLSILDFNYLVATSAGVEYFTERHELGLFSHEEYLATFHENHFETIYVADGLMGRGLYIGRKQEA